MEFKANVPLLLKAPPSYLILRPQKLDVEVINNPPSLPILRLPLKVATTFPKIDQKTPGLIVRSVISYPSSFLSRVTVSSEMTLAAKVTEAKIHRHSKYRSTNICSV